jgi:hypothetical protein
MLGDRHKDTLRDACYSLLFQYLCGAPKESATVGENWGKQGGWLKQDRGIFS